MPQYALYIGSVRLPVTPDNIRRARAADYVDYDLIEGGEYSFPRGRKLRRYNFGAFLPGEARIRQPWVLYWTDPYTASETLGYYCENGIYVPFSVEHYFTEHYVTIESISDNVQKGYGDITFEIQLKEYRELALGFEGDTTSNRVVRPGRAPSGTQTTIIGDTWAKVSHDQFGVDTYWSNIRDANPLATMNPNGTLDPGQTLVIPTINDPSIPGVA